MMHVTSMPGNEWANHAGSMHVMFLGQRSRSDDSVVIISHQEFFANASTSYKTTPKILAIVTVV